MFFFSEIPTRTSNTVEEFVLIFRIFNFLYIPSFLKLDPSNPFFISLFAKFLKRICWGVFSTFIILWVGIAVMTGQNMAAITESLERSLQNCSLDHHNGGGEGSAIIGLERSSTSDAPEENLLTNSDPTLELNSEISLPYHWEQCLDLKTGEIYYINWRNGMKANEDPRSIPEYSGDYYSEDDESSYDSDDSTSESASYVSSEQYRPVDKKEDHVLVVAGCKSCLMYYMVPKQVEDCPKCTGQLLHFDRSDNTSP